MNQQQIKKWMLENDRWKNAMAAGFLTESNLADYFFEERAPYLKEDVRRQDVWAAAEQVIDELIRNGSICSPAHWR